jgi:hypothetical protein
MPNVTITPPAVIQVQVGPTINPKATSINYGGGAVNFQIQNASDLSMAGAITGDAIIYNSITNSFVLAPVASSNIDNGFF